MFINLSGSDVLRGLRTSIGRDPDLVDGEEINMDGMAIRIETTSRKVTNHMHPATEVEGKVIPPSLISEFSSRWLLGYESC